MTRKIEYTLSEIAVELGVPLDSVIGAKSMLPISPTRRDAAGMGFYDRKALSLLHRALIEKDPTAFLERREAGAPQVTVPPSEADQRFLDALLSGDIAAAEAMIETDYPLDQ